MKIKSALINLIIIAGATALLQAIPGCTSATQRDNTVQQESRGYLAISVEPLRDLVSAVAGDEWDVVTLAGRGSNPENFDPTATTLRKASEAQLIFTTGGLGFEDEVAHKLSGSAARIVDLSAAITPLTGTHSCTCKGSEDHHHDETVDPHIWNSLLNAAALTRTIGTHLAGIDPANAAYYIHNADSIARVYLATDSIVRTRIQPGSAFLVGHPSLSYFARDYCLRQIAIGEEHKEMSVQAMRKAIDKAHESGATVYFAENDADSLRASTITQQSGIQITITDLQSPDIFSTIAKVCGALCQKSTP